MKKYEIIRRIQNEENQKVVLVQVGIFYISIGIDAYILHELLGLKLNEYAKDKFKVGVPINVIEKYVNLLKQENIPFCVYKNIVENKNVKKESKYGYEKIYENSTEIKCEIKNATLDKENILNSLFEIKLLKSYVENSEKKINAKYLGDRYE